MKSGMIRQVKLVFGAAKERTNTQKTEYSFAKKVDACADQIYDQCSNNHTRNQGEHLSSAVVGLEKTFEVAQDNVWKGKGINVSTKNHHLADLAHHPTPMGLLAAIVVHFLKVGVFVNKNGKLHIIPTKDAQNETAEVLAPVIITAIMNWLVCIAEKCGTDEEHEIPAALFGIVHLIATTPLIVEFVKCVNNWFGHQVSDMAGSGKTAGGGMGIPGVFVSLLYEFAALPIMKDTGLPGFLNDLYENKHFDLRHEIPFYKAAGKQAIPMLINELCVRVSFFISQSKLWSTNLQIGKTLSLKAFLN